MSDSLPANDLDRAIMAVCRSRAATPELYRRLGEGELSETFRTWVGVREEDDVVAAFSFTKFS